jgi:hypothetical protein
METRSPRRIVGEQDPPQLILRIKVGRCESPKQVNYVTLWLEFRGREEKL